MGKEWSDEEVDLLKEIYPHYTNKELSATNMKIQS